MDIPELRSWLRRTKRTPEAREAAAQAIGTSVAYLYQLAGQHRRASPQMAMKVERVIGVPRHALRPDIWGT